MHLCIPGIFPLSSQKISLLIIYTWKNATSTTSDSKVEEDTTILKATLTTTPAQNKEAITIFNATSITRNMLTGKGYFSFWVFQLWFNLPSYKGISSLIKLSISFHYPSLCLFSASLRSTLMTIDNAFINWKRPFL